MMYNFDLLMRSQVATKVIISQDGRRFFSPLFDAATCNSIILLKERQFQHCLVRYLRRSAKTQPKKRTQTWKRWCGLFLLRGLYSSISVSWAGPSWCFNAPCWRPVVASGVLGFFLPKFFDSCFLVSFTPPCVRCGFSFLNLSFMASCTPVVVSERCPELLLLCFLGCSFWYHGLVLPTVVSW